MSYLKDTAIDIINAAKSSKDADAKIFALGQIKEILLHRQKELLPTLISDVFSFMVERNASVRKFLVRFSTDLFNQDPAPVLPKLLEMYTILLSDSNDNVLSATVKEMSKIYSKMVLFIATIPDSQEGGLLWESLKTILNKFQDYLVSARSDNLKYNCIRLMEEQVLFALPSTTTSADPRLARKDPRLSRATQKDYVGSATNNNTAEAISLHHAVISRIALQKEGEDVFTRFSSWLLKGGPVNYPWSPNLHANIAQMLASVGTIRPGHSLHAAKIVTQFITEKSGIVAQIESSHLESMARAATRLLRATSVYASDPEGLMHKLKAAINSLNITSIIETDALGVGKKRDLSEISVDEEDDAGVDNEKYRHSLIEALDAAEAARREQQERAAAAALSLFQSKSLNVESEVKFDESTELSSDILSIETSALRFNTVLMSIGQTVSSSGENLVCCPIPPTDGKEYNDLCIFSLLKLLENYVSVTLSGDSAVNQYKEIITRTVLSMIISSIDNESYTNVKIITSWSRILSKSHIEGLPTTVSVPSFALQTASIGPSQEVIDLEKDISQKVEFLVKLCNDICDCTEENWDNEEGSSALNGIYESTVLAIMCRMLQIPHLREFCKTFLLSLHKIPPPCVRVLKLLVASGNEGTGTKENNSRYRGTRGDALSIVANLVAFADDIDIATECLHYLLWNTLEDNFELRSRTIDVITNEILKQNDWCNERIFRFAIQSLATSLGVHGISDESFVDIYQGDTSVPTLKQVMSDLEYDQGAAFNGLYKNHFHQNVVEDFSKSAHFFNRLCLDHADLLPVYMELCAVISMDQSHRPNLDVLLGLLKSALKDIVPAIHRAYKDLEIFDLLEKVTDRNTRVLMTYALGLLHTDFSMPAKPSLIAKVYRYVGGYIDERLDESGQSEDSTNTISSFNPEIFTIEDDDDFKLFIPLISGLNSIIIEKCLPRIIRLYNEDSDGLEVVFNRIIRARPPPMTKTALLIALHRINIEHHDMKTKTLTQAIAICLKNSSDFNSTVIRDALQILINDEVPHVVLMRTALLSANSFSEIKKFVLERIIPSLIHRCVWTTAPKVWEGVMVGADNLTSGSTGKSVVEPTLKALLGIPGNILKSVLKVTKNLKKVLAKYLQGLPVQERDDVLTGKGLGSNVDYIELPQDNDKKKIVKELLSFNPDAPSK